jgi:hypothetical protein
VVELLPPVGADGQNPAPCYWALCQKLGLEHHLWSDPMSSHFTAMSVDVEAVSGIVEGIMEMRSGARGVSVPHPHSMNRIPSPSLDSVDSASLGATEAGALRNWFLKQKKSFSQPPEPFSPHVPAYHMRYFASLSETMAVRVSSTCNASSSSCLWVSH